MTEEKKKNVSREITFKFQNHEYKLEFPNVGQYIQIESDKLEVTNGYFGSLLSLRTLSSVRVLQMAEAVCVLKNLCPKVFEDMKVSSYKELDAMDFAELVREYNKQISEWYADWFKEFNEVFKIVSDGVEELDKEEKEVEEK